MASHELGSTLSESWNMNGEALGLADNLIYASPRIFERRRRILEETHKLIASHGFENFRMRELCRRAEVASHTIYKAFGSKERLIALAIRHQFDAFATTFTLKYPRRSLLGALERVIVGHVTMLDMKEYVKAVTSVYFSLNVDDDLRMAAGYNVTLTVRPWALALERQGSLRPGVTADQLVDQILRLKFTVSQDWCRDAITDEQFLAGKTLAVLTVAAGLCRGSEYQQLSMYLDDFLGSRSLFEELRHEVTQWPAAGLVDTEIRCFHQLESINAEKEVYPRVQA
jgi:TetR/AcrR family transcriptional regulator, cholesterol catabolism regulator